MRRIFVSFHHGGDLPSAFASYLSATLAHEHPMEKRQAEQFASVHHEIDRVMDDHDPDAYKRPISRAVERLPKHVRHAIKTLSRAVIKKRKR